MQNVVFSSEKDSNGQKHSSGSHQSIKRFPQQYFSFLPLGGFRPPLNGILKTLRCVQLIHTYRRTGVPKCLHLHTKERRGVKFWIIFCIFCIHARLNTPTIRHGFTRKRRKKMKSIQECCLERTCRLKTPANSRHKAI